MGLARAMLGPVPLGLGSLCRTLGTKTQKIEFDDFDGPVTPEGINYCRTDVQCTFELYCKLRGIYLTHGINTSIRKLFSEASVGKAHLKMFGIVPFKKGNEHAVRAAVHTKETLALLPQEETPVAVKSLPRSKKREAPANR
jgi:hypothetical protein